MKKTMFILLLTAFFAFAVNGQTSTTDTKSTQTTAEKKPKKAVFRANKAQVTQAQKMLKAAETGKMDPEFKTAVKAFQKENGLKQSGSLNRATLEKMNIELTDAQKEIPVSPNSFAKTDDKTGEAKPRKAVFRANKEQIMEAQKKLKTGAMYAGEETGKLDDATREGIKKFQAANGVKVTGTLNKETLVKMGITLTDKQKES